MSEEKQVFYTVDGELFAKEIADRVYNWVQKDIRRKVFAKVAEYAQKRPQFMVGDIFELNYRIDVSFNYKMTEDGDFEYAGTTGDSPCLPH